MDDSKKPPSKGRGSLLLQMMKESKLERLHHSLETPSCSSTEQTRSFETASPQSSFTSSANAGVGAGRGRGQLTSLLKSMSLSSSGSESRGPTQLQPMGRGSFLGSRERPE